LGIGLRGRVNLVVEKAISVQGVVISREVLEIQRGDSIGRGGSRGVTKKSNNGGEEEGSKDDESQGEFFHAN
jgi:hypothetical protein